MQGGIFIIFRAGVSKFSLPVILTMVGGWGDTCPATLHSQPEPSSQQCDERNYLQRSAQMITYSTSTQNKGWLVVLHCVASSNSFAKIKVWCNSYARGKSGEFTHIVCKKMFWSCKTIRLGLLECSYIVEPVHNGHPWNHAKWLLYRGGLLIEVGGALGLY